MNIHLDTPNVGELEKEYLCKAVDSTYVSTIGPFVSEFEDSFARFLGLPKAVGTQSGTAALHMAMVEEKIGPGDEVIVPALTFVATVNPVVYVGATPVFADVDPATWDLSPEAIEAATTPKTKAIIPVHLYGNPCNMAAIMDIAMRNNLLVIEDATESAGAKYKGRYTGTLGHWGCFSFNGNKILTTGGGGMIVGNDQQKLNHIKFLVNQARDETRGYYHPEIGYNYRLTNIEAALGLAQLSRLETFLQKKRRFREIYFNELSSISGIEFQAMENDCQSSCWFTAIKFKERSSADIQQKLKEKGVPSRRNFYPITEFAPYKSYKRTELPNTYELFEHGLCLPGSTVNSEENISEVCRIIKQFF
ncbi:MAG: DegT/DnrJ/EryC1/StrS family aminotransferase [Candidatus Margulisbacteria bacterium]|nr:DegT/DnrJ/EryC1/StrS family aminotransferase [Candidatus Margulisiibacteriota bacterium]